MFFFSPRPISAAATAAAVVILLSIFFDSTFATNATLANDEVEALKKIGERLGKVWDFGVDPCSGAMGWAPRGEKRDKYNVSCDPSVSNDTFNHVVTIVLKQQQLNGTLPPELVKLPYLHEIDLTRNYIGGTLPLEWGSMKHLKIFISFSYGVPKYTLNELR